MSASVYLHLYFFVLYAMTMATSTSIVLKLIHSDLVTNVYGDATATLLQRTDHSSMERYKYLDRRITESSSNEGIQTNIAPNIYANSFYVNFSIGEPPVWKIVAVDSGSYLLWVPCQTCNFQSYPIYDPSNSSTYTKLSCDSRHCGEFGDCTKHPNCPYSLQYGDSSTTEGELGLEELKFWSTLDNDTTSLPGVVFGCGHNNKGKGMENGILGLGAHRLSLVYQLGSRFSYCIGDIHNIGYEHNRLVIGEYANLEGASTPLQTDGSGLYYVTLDGISVGDKRLDIDEKLFKRKTLKDGVIIDSGSTITYLARSAFYLLSEEVQKLLDGQVQRVLFPFRPNDLCYSGRISDQLIGFPTVTFHFAGDDADFFVENEGVFRQYRNDTFCLAVEPVSDTQFSVIGISAQQYYNIGYDLKSMTLYFDNIDCELLE